MAFDDIVGNSRVKKILRRSLERGRVPNSLLFAGPEGVGKRQTALVVAKALNCLRKKDDACEECDHCRLINSGNMPDVIEVDVKELRPDRDNSRDEPEAEEGESGEAGRDTIGIKTMRGIKELVHLRPMLGRSRVFIINEAEKMTPEAANSHLKILEEPPLFSTIILISENPSLILPTIKSRCQVLSFLPISDEEIERVLRDRGIERGKARIMASLAHGNLELASSLDWDEIERRRREAWDLFDSVIGEKESSLFLRNFAFQRRNVIREDLTQTLELFSSFCRDILLLKVNGASALLFNPDYEPDLVAAERSLGLEPTLRFLSQTDRALANLDRSLNANLLASSFYSQVRG